MLIKRRKHSMPELNTTSTADISFMLLTFFLVTTSMDVDRGLVRQLPPMDDTQDETVEATEVSRDNTLAFKITADGKIMLNDSPADTTHLRRDIARFISSRLTQHVIYVDADPAADYNTYFVLENEIVAAYNEVRDGIARRKFHRPYAALDEERRQQVRDICPQHISETYNTSASSNGNAPATSPADNQEGGEK
mgnify:CR=1 FL=1